jgi:hypothetical protein
VGLAAIRFREHHGTSLEPPVALFLPKSVCEMNRRRVLTELGPDSDAQRVEDREGVLFDLWSRRLAAASGVLRKTEE